MTSKPALAASLIMNFLDMEEVRIENHKMSLPIKLKGTETDNEQTVLVLFCNGETRHSGKGY